MNLISTTQHQNLESLGFPMERLASHLAVFRQNTKVDASALKKLCPYIITTGQNEKGWFATTRQSTPEWVDKHDVKIAAIDNSRFYVYGETEIDAIYQLILTQTQNRLYAPSDCKFKIPLDPKTYA